MLFWGVWGVSGIAFMALSHSSDPGWGQVHLYFAGEVVDICFLNMVC